MTRMNLNSPSTTTIAVAADYADAMMTARRAKNWLFILLLLVLLTQIALFFLLKFNVIRLSDEMAVEITPTSAPAAVTQPSDAATQPTAELSTSGTAAGSAPEARKGGRVEDILRYVIPVTDFLGIALVVILAVVLLLIVTIMLVGRLIGVSHVTSAFIWCVLLAVMIFPWQAFLLGTYRAARPPADVSPGLADAYRHADPTYKIPGALYTWEELRRDYNFDNLNGWEALLKWTRFAAFPIVALLVLLMVQAKSSRGLKFALGESEVQVEVSTSRV